MKKEIKEEKVEPLPIPRKSEDIKPMTDKDYYELYTTGRGSDAWHFLLVSLIISV